MRTFRSWQATVNTQFELTVGLPKGKSHGQESADRGDPRCVLANGVAKKTVSFVSFFAKIRLPSATVGEGQTELRTTVGGRHGQFAR